MAYTPGHSERSIKFMAARDAREHFGFVLPHLAPGMRLLDCGCGPGTLTAQLAALVTPGQAVGIDASGEQFALGHAAARALGDVALELTEAQLPPLPFPDAAFDAVTAHALLEHASDPTGVLAEMHRVLRPGGVAGVCAVDWGGFLVIPDDKALQRALRDYEELMHANGGSPRLGPRLPVLVKQAGFELIDVGARYESHADLSRIADYLAATLERSGKSGSATALRRWSEAGSLFAQAWVWAVARRRGGDQAGGVKLASQSPTAEPTASRSLVRA